MNVKESFIITVQSKIHPSRLHFWELLDDEGNSLRVSCDAAYYYWSLKTPSINGTLYCGKGGTRKYLIRHALNVLKQGYPAIHKMRLVNSGSF